MTDLKTSANPLFLREQELRRGIELLFFAYRDFTKEPDQVLARYRCGRAHHRVIHFVRRQPGIIVSDLLRVLQITKQSLSRVLSHLIDEGLIIQHKGEHDRRRRHLHLTERGIELEDELSRLQRARVARAYREAGAEAVAGFHQVLAGLIDQDDRKAVLERFRI
ncbi:MAG: MarR family winged helix-turn-helix transcriptional regulator [Sphingomonadales bacterium]